MKTIILSLGTYIGLFVLGIVIPIVSIEVLSIDTTWRYLAPLGIWGFFGYVIPTIIGSLKELEEEKGE